MTLTMRAHDITHLVAVIFTAFRDHVATEAALAVLAIVLIFIFILGILDGLAQRRRLFLVLEPDEGGATDVLGARAEVVEEAVLGGRTIYLRTVPHMDLVRMTRADC